MLDRHIPIFEARLTHFNPRYASPVLACWACDVLAGSLHLPRPGREIDYIYPVVRLLARHCPTTP